MVRKYGKKNNKEKSYDQNTFKKAVDKIKQGHSMKGTAKKYAIPYSTLLHVKNKPERSVRPTAIPEIEELKLANGLKTMGMGFIP